jgi:AraC family transcriptional regulator of adaptative response/methylated-DNA-[protein]-cysteine methyltransferase
MPELEQRPLRSQRPLRIEGEQRTAATTVQRSGLRMASPAECPSDAEWQIVIERRPAVFLYAVRTTGVFCRTTCTSRRPLRAHVRCYCGVEAARSAGFRACLRCRPELPQSTLEVDALLEPVSAYLAAHLDRHVSLAELGQFIGLSPFTVLRRFQRATGVSPSGYARSLRADALQRALLQGSNVTDAVYAAGYSGPGRAAENAPLGMTARALRRGGVGERIGYRVEPIDTLGLLLMAATDRGVCAVLFGDATETLQQELAQRFPAAELVPELEMEDREQVRLLVLMQMIVKAIYCPSSKQAVPLDLRGTVFQARVWEALRTLRPGQTCTYGEVAATLGLPKAVRAVARACGANPVAVVVPCHRVISKNGQLTGYRWGLERKRTLLAAESTLTPDAPIA